MNLVELIVFTLAFFIVGILFFHRFYLIWFRYEYYIEQVEKNIDLASKIHWPFNQFARSWIPTRSYKVLARTITLFGILIFVPMPFLGIYAILDWLF